MANVAQYITIVDKSNKVIGTSKHFKGLWQEAKTGYQERKAEIKAQRRVKEEAELQKAIRAVSIADETERASQYGRPTPSRRQSEQRVHGRRSPPSAYDERPRAQRMHSSGSVHSNHDRPRQHSTGHVSLGEFNQQLYGGQTRTAPRDPYAAPVPGITRARTDMQLLQQQRPGPLVQSRSMDDIDMNLAYGEFHPQSLVEAGQQEKELKSLVARCKGLLEEADCAGHSARAIIGHLQKNPDTLAAVGLTLAEISNIAGKMAPGALAAFSKTAPAVVALLASPQFLVAVGVSVGVTIIAIGGYKIVKRIREGGSDEDGTKTPTEGNTPEEAIDLRELDRIEMWRRGIADAHVRGLEDETASVISGTSVEGEFITPYAQRSMGHLPLPPKSKSGKSRSGDKEEKKKKKHRRRGNSDGDTDTVVSRSSTGSSRRHADKSEKMLVKTKKPSPLSRMFSSSGKSEVVKVRDFA